MDICYYRCDHGWSVLLCDRPFAADNMPGYQHHYDCAYDLVMDARAGCILGWTGAVADRIDVVHNGLAKAGVDVLVVDVPRIDGPLII